MCMYMCVLCVRAVHVCTVVCVHMYACVHAYVSCVFVYMYVCVVLMWLWLHMCASVCMCIWRTRRLSMPEQHMGVSGEQLLLSEPGERTYSTADLVRGTADLPVYGSRPRVSAQRGWERIPHQCCESILLQAVERHHRVNGSVIHFLSTAILSTFCAYTVEEENWTVTNGHRFVLQMSKHSYWTFWLGLNDLDQSDYR